MASKPSPQTRDFNGTKPTACRVLTHVQHCPAEQQQAGRPDGER